MSRLPNVIKTQVKRQVIKKTKSQEIPAVIEALRGTLDDQKVESRDTIRDLVSMTRGGNPDSTVNLALMSLATLAEYHSDNRRHIYEVGGLDALLNVAATATDKEASHLAARVVGYTCQFDRARNSVVKGPGLDMLTKVSNRDEGGGSAGWALAMMGVNTWETKIPGHRGVRILSLDGGGMRGVGTIEILKCIEECAGRPVHDLFDVICGTSTGGILVTLMGLQRRPLDECEQLYMNLGEKVFARVPLVNTIRLMTTGSKYDHRTFEEVLKSNLRGDHKMYDYLGQPRDTNKCFMVSSLVSTIPAVPYLHRNYVLNENHESRYDGSCNHYLWESVRASCAAPSYFPEIVLGNRLLSDGGLVANNPTAIAIHEAKCIWPDKPIQCVVSVGTGVNVNQRDSKASQYAAIAQTIINSATDTENVHYVMSDMLPEDRYYRMNPVEETFDRSLDDNRPETLEAIKGAARRFAQARMADIEKMSDILTGADSTWSRLSRFLMSTSTSR